MRFDRGTTIKAFWGHFPANTKDKLLDCELGGRGNTELELKLPGLGDVCVYLDECSEGADRGGYVKWVQCTDVADYDGEAILLEADTDGSEFFFAGRSSIL